MPIVVDVPGVGPTEFPDQASAEQFFKTQRPQGQDFGSEVSGPQHKQIKLPADVQQAFDYANQFPLGSKARDKAWRDAEGLRDNFLKLNPPDKQATPPKFTEKDIENISSIKDAQAQMRKLLELKNSGFGGQGIDTGPIASLTPAPLSEWINRNIGKQGEHSGDRGLLRQEVMDLMNPIRKSTTGAQASTQELQKFIFPTIPNESDNDQTFFKKGFEGLSYSQQKLINLIDTLKKSGVDVSQFEKDASVLPEELVKQIQGQLSQNRGGSFSQEYPDTAKTFLGGIVQGNNPQSIQPQSSPQDQMAILKQKAQEALKRRMSQ